MVSLIKNQIKRSSRYKNFFSTFILSYNNNNNYQFKRFIQKTYFNSTTKIKFEHFSATIDNKDYCSGCGAKFQIKDSLKPGYLIKPSSTTSTTTVSLSKRNEKINEKSNSKKKLNKQEIEDAINNLPEDLKKLMYPSFEYSKKKTTTTITTTKQEEEERIFCQRCYNLKYHNKIVLPSSSSSSWQETLTTDESFLSFLKEKKNSIILTIIDIIDFPGSLIKNLDNLIGKNNLNILIANKIDLLPKSVIIDDKIDDSIGIKDYLKNYCSKYGLKNIHEIFLCSAKKSWMIKDLCNEIKSIKNYNDDIYLIGNTNVGKSELINSFLKNFVYNSKNYKVTSSHIPGTTINILGLPLNIFGKTFDDKNVEGVLFNQDDCRFLFDTPGIVNENQLYHFLNQEELKMVIPQKNIRPLTYIFKPGKSLLFGGLGRIDYKKGKDPIRITVFSGLDSHMTSIEKADEFYEQLSFYKEDHFLKPPIGSSERLKKFPKIIKSMIDLKVTVSDEKLYMRTKKVSILDVVWSSIGWCSIGGVKIGESAIFDVWSPDGKGVYVRDIPLLPYEFRGKIEKIR